MIRSILAVLTGFVTWFIVATLGNFVIRALLPGVRAAYQNPHAWAQLEAFGKRMEAWQEKRAPGHVAAMRQMMAGRIDIEEDIVRIEVTLRLCLGDLRGSYHARDSCCGSFQTRSSTAFATKGPCY